MPFSLVPVYIFELQLIKQALTQKITHARRSHSLLVSSLQTIVWSVYTRGSPGIRTRELAG